MSRKTLTEKFDDELNDTLDQGMEMVDKQTGDVVRVRPNAAYMNVIRQRIKDLEAKDQNSLTEPQHELMRKAAIRFKGRSIGEVSDEPDIATG